MITKKEQIRRDRKTTRVWVMSFMGTERVCHPEHGYGTIVDCTANRKKIKVVWDSQTSKEFDASEVELL